MAFCHARQPDFNESGLSESLPGLLNGIGMHVVADGGYQLSVHVMTPFRRDHRLQLVWISLIFYVNIYIKFFLFIQYEERYNAILSVNRQVI